MPFAAFSIAAGSPGWHEGGELRLSVISRGPLSVGRSRVPSAASVLAALTIGLTTSGTAVAQNLPDPPPPPPMCGPGQIPTPENPCFGPNPIWPDPVGTSRSCADYYTWATDTPCPAITVHYTPVAVPMPDRDAGSNAIGSASATVCQKLTGYPTCMPPQLSPTPSEQPENEAP